MYKSSVRYLGALGTGMFVSYFEPLKNELRRANFGVLFEVYVGRMLFFSILGFAAFFIFGTIFSMFMFNALLLFAIVSGILFGMLGASAILTIFYYYPLNLLSSKRNSIEGNMPFAINHMAAISASGVPPFIVFKLLMNVKEYGEISNEFRRIVRNVEVFGMDLISSVRNVSDRTPSAVFSQFLNSIVSIVNTGGDLKIYLEGSAKDALFNYKIERQRYLQTLSTYADIYTAVLIASPLFFVSILSIMSLIGGDVFGMDIPSAMRIGIFLMIPMLNTIFIMFVHYTQPKG